MLVHDAPLDARAAARILAGAAVRPLSVQRLFGGLKPDQLQGLDLVFVPHWYCRFRVVADLARGQHVAPAVWTIVEALTGAVLRLAGEPPLVERDLAALRPAVAVEPAVAREEAVARAREALRWDLRVRGRQRLAPRAVELAEARLAYVPFWVGYFADGQGGLRVRALHGIERQLQPDRFVQALLRALA